MWTRGFCVVRRYRMVSALSRVSVWKLSSSTLACITSAVIGLRGFCDDHLVVDCASKASPSKLGLWRKTLAPLSIVFLFLTVYVPAAGTMWYRQRNFTAASPQQECGHCGPNWDPYAGCLVTPLHTSQAKLAPYAGCLVTPLHTSQAKLVPYAGCLVTPLHTSQAKLGPLCWMFSDSAPHKPNWHPYAGCLVTPLHTSQAKLAPYAGCLVTPLHTSQAKLGALCWMFSDSAPHVRGNWDPYAGCLVTPLHTSQAKLGPLCWMFSDSAPHKSGQTGTLCWMFSDSAPHKSGQTGTLCWMFSDSAPHVRPNWDPYAGCLVTPLHTSQAKLGPLCWMFSDSAPHKSGQTGTLMLDV
ncbi:hypothetical protein RRG08_026377 [Elysia crispata]|uniref:Uncharacterized protein n=1 Tax=Elysia crispata TaxID=231223 RepID=A0AAE0XRH6_9GAST|nr:hypothetical protein RRG08_026377 [Elysia crispata]